jgi:hypothetical protein
MMYSTIRNVAESMILIAIYSHDRDWNCHKTRIELVHAVQIERRNAVLRRHSEIHNCSWSSKLDS